MNDQKGQATTERTLTFYATIFLTTYSIYVSVMLTCPTFLEVFGVVVFSESDV